MLRKIGWIFFGLWAILSVGILGRFVDSTGRTEAEDPTVRSELEVKLGWELLILNLPLSLAVAAVLPDLPGLKEARPITEWCVLTFVGFVQWAFVLPAALERARRAVTRRHVLCKSRVSAGTSR
jgi:hypothetical protein